MLVKEDSPCQLFGDVWPEKVHGEKLESTASGTTWRVTFPEPLKQQLSLPTSLLSPPPPHPSVISPGGGNRPRGRYCSPVYCCAVAHNRASRPSAAHDIKKRKAYLHWRTLQPATPSVVTAATHLCCIGSLSFKPSIYINQSTSLIKGLIPSKSIFCTILKLSFIDTFFSLPWKNCQRLWSFLTHGFNIGVAAVTNDTAVTVTRSWAVAHVTNRTVTLASGLHWCCTDRKQLTCEKPSRLMLRLKRHFVCRRRCFLLIVKVAERRASFFFRSISRFSSTAAEMNLLGEMRNTHSREGKKNNKNLKHSFSFSSRYLQACLPPFLLSFSGSSLFSRFSHSHSRRLCFRHFIAYCSWLRVFFLSIK